MMIHADGWMESAKWIWTVMGLLVLALSTLAFAASSLKKSRIKGPPMK